MIYESEQGNMTMALVGDVILNRALSPFREERFLQLTKLLRAAQVSFANLEMLVHEWEGYPGFYAWLPTGAHPRMLEELKWMGIKMVSCANNHAYDYGEAGVLANISNLEKAQIPNAGSGRNLRDARAPAYLDTPGGRVALIATNSTAAEEFRAGDQRADMQGRPGINPLRHIVNHYVDYESFETLNRISQELGWEKEKAQRALFGFPGALPPTNDGEFYFLDRKFIRSRNFHTHTIPHPKDLEENLRWVSDAARQNDWVLVSLHHHEQGETPEEPAEFAREFAHACIDSGAHAVIGHGPHFLRGIEIYRDRPIFYSLGNFIFQEETIERLPQQSYDRYGLGWDATPADFYDIFASTGKRHSMYWEGVVAECIWENRKLTQVILHPIELGCGKSRSQRGRPLLAERQASEVIIERLQGLSAPYGTHIESKNNVGIIKL